MASKYETCTNVLEYLCTQFGDDPNTERCQAVKRHLDNCPDCEKYCQSLEKMIALYRASAPQFSPEAREAILTLLGIRTPH